MLIGGNDIMKDVITLGTSFLVFVYICTHFHIVLIGGNMTAKSTGSHRRNLRWNSDPRDVVASSSSFSSPAARGPVELALRLPSQDQVNLFLAFKK